MILELSNSSASAKVNTLGAELVSFKRDDGFELLWQGDPSYWGGQAPVLFPIVGALRNGKVQIGGQWYEMGRHGFARKMEFSVSLLTESRVELVLCSNEKTRAFYPFEFAFTVAYSLCDKGITTEFIVKNTGDMPVPFSVGGHPGYNIPLAENETFEDYVIEFEKPENQCCPEIDLAECLIDFSKCTKELKGETTIPLRHELFYRDALVFENLNSKKVKLKSLKSGRSLEMEFGDFTMLGIWSSVNDGPYVALEPWTGCATTTEEGDCFEKKRGMTVLSAGEKRSYSFTTLYQ